jgi:hypothetical protein
MLLEVSDSILAGGTWNLEVTWGQRTRSKNSQNTGFCMRMVQVETE